MTAFQSALGFGSITNGGNSGPRRIVRSVSDIQTALNDGPGTVIVQAGGIVDERNSDGLFLIPSGITLVADPSFGGVLVRGTAQVIGKQDVIVRNFTFAPGWGQPIPAVQTDACTMGNNSARLIFDMCRFLFSKDECIGVGFNCSDITVMRSIIAWGLRNAGHPDGEHSKAVMNAHTGVYRATYYLNVLLNCNDRNIRCINDGDIEIINNLVVNYGVGTHLADGAQTTPTRLHFIGNNYLPGPNTPSGRKALVGDPNSVRAKVYVRDNRGPGRENGTGDEWLITNLPTSKRSLVPMFTSLIPDSAIRPSSQITLALLAEIGTKPADELTQRLISDGTNGAWIDNPSDLGIGTDGYPTIISLSVPDSDSDGIPDAYEFAFSDPNDYLEAALMGTLPSPDTEAPVVVIVLPTPASRNKLKGNVAIGVTATDNVAVVRVETLIDGFVKNIDTTAPYSWVWDTRTVSNGDHIITVEAFDAMGNMGSQRINVRVNNPGHAIVV